MDPLPENISGEKVVVHRVDHEIQWAYVAIGVAVILLVLVVFDPFGGDPEEEQPRLGDVQP